MNRVGKNVGASLHARLVRLAHERQEIAQFVLERYALERLLYRLSRSPYRNRFVLKGATLFALWGGMPQRPTRDIDLLGFGDSSLEGIGEVLRELCRMDVADDGVVFDATSVTAEPIKEADEYPGVRLHVSATIGQATVRLKADVGFGDDPKPAIADADYPSLLADMPQPHLRVYPKEAVVAEKFHAMTVRGLLNSRMKDFLDIATIARRFEFEAAVLTESIAATFARRQTAFPDDVPLVLTPLFYAHPDKVRQWVAYHRKSGLRSEPFDTVGQQIADFLGEPFTALQRRLPMNGRWPAGGPWT